jgi:two-component system, NarL family, invasion response regulator UvrY
MATNSERSARPPSDPAHVGVVTVDDQAHFRSAAQEVIEATPGFASLGEACSGEEALVVVGEHEPELVLVDVRMPGMDGIETTRRIKAAHPEMVVVLVSIGDPADIPSTAATSGAVALLRKQDFRPATLHDLWVEHGGEGEG